MEKKGLGKGGCALILGGLLTVFVIVPCAGIFMWSAASSARVQARLEKLRAEGSPTTPDELSAAYRVPEDAEDVTSLYLQALPPLETPEFGQAAKNLPVVGVGGPEGPIPPPGTPWAEKAAVEKLLQQYAESMQLLHEATSKGGYARFDRDFNEGFSLLLTHVQQLRSGSRMLKLEAHVNAHNGDVAATLKSLEAMFIIGRACERDPVIVSQLVQHAMDGMAIATTVELLPHVDFDDQQLARLQQLARNQNYLRTMQDALRGEQVLAMQGFQDPNSLGEDGLDAAFLLGPRNEDLDAYLGLMEKMLDAMDDSWVEAIRASEETEAELQTLVGSPVNRMRYVMTAMIFPALKAANLAGVRTHSQRELLDVILATERFKLANNQYPKTIEELVPMYLPAVPMDPHDGKPIRFEIRNGFPFGWAIGRNLTDDGGEGDESGDPDVIMTLAPAQPKPADESEQQ